MSGLQQSAVAPGALAGDTGLTAGCNGAGRVAAGRVCEEDRVCGQARCMSRGREPVAELGRRGLSRVGLDPA